eukprot:COSAG01_NODE_27413_length_686_cov_1.345826_2_plen_50_part_01
MRCPGWRGVIVADIRERLVTEHAETLRRAQAAEEKAEHFETRTKRTRKVN